MTQMTHYLTTIIGWGQTPAMTRHSALDNYVVTRNGATTDFMICIQRVFNKSWIHIGLDIVNLISFRMTLP